jgi:hypothetical protein
MLSIFRDRQVTGQFFIPSIEKFYRGQNGIQNILERYMVDGNSLDPDGMKNFMDMTLTLRTFGAE